jgi:hypothetical protein
MAKFWLSIWRIEADICGKKSVGIHLRNLKSDIPPRVKSASLALTMPPIKTSLKLLHAGKISL